jgi:hypothetical protein
MQHIGRGMNIWWIDFDRLEVYEAGAMLVTLLAYPEKSEETHSEVHASLCANALRVKCAKDPDWAIPSHPIKPIYALRRQDQNDRVLRTLERRVRDRMIAGRMAIGFLKEAVTGEVPPPLKRLSINELAQLDSPFSPRLAVYFGRPERRVCGRFWHSLDDDGASGFDLLVSGEGAPQPLFQQLGLHQGPGIQLLSLTTG